MTIFLRSTDTISIYKDMKHFAFIGYVLGVMVFLINTVCVFDKELWFRTFEEPYFYLNI